MNKRTQPEAASRRYEAAMARLVPDRVNHWPVIDTCPDPERYEYFGMTVAAFRAALIAAGEAALKGGEDG